MLNYTTLANKSESLNNLLGEQALNLLDRTFYIPDDFNFNIFEVTEEYVARPDLVSYEAYGDDMYGDVICKINGISNPFELNVGMQIILPQTEYINDFTYKPNPSELALDTDETYDLPKPKLKNQKRKANEAVVGDTRFKVDPEKRVIIY